MVQMLTWNLMNGIGLLERVQPACTWQRKLRGGMRARGARVQGGDMDGTTAVAGNEEDTANTGTTLIRCRGQAKKYEFMPTVAADGAV